VCTSSKENLSIFFFESYKKNSPQKPESYFNHISTGKFCCMNKLEEIIEKVQQNEIDIKRLKTTIVDQNRVINNISLRQIKSIVERLEKLTKDVEEIKEHVSKTDSQ
jgi:uncharacterized protein (UPF0335 family)